MAEYGERSVKEVTELEDALDLYEDTHGSNEFTEGALAVIKWMVGEEGPTTVEAFVNEYLAERK